jgi:hypothetical protein
VSTPASSAVPDREPDDTVGLVIPRPGTRAVEPEVPAVPALPAPESWSGTVIDPVAATADDIAARVLAIPDVVRLHPGRFGEVATYLPGRRVTGVKLGSDLIEVHVVIAGKAPARQTAQLIHATVASLVATPVHVYIDDVAA